jgi:endonuclease/exonuclease/phosphatase family metal-dependent hydrolase
MKRQSLILSRILEYLLPVLLFSFGFQALRVFIPSLAWYLRDTVGTSTTSLIPYAFVPFLLGFLAALIFRLAGFRRGVWITGGGLAIIRLVDQIIQDPGIDFWLSAAGVVFFLNFIPIFLGYCRMSGVHGTQRWVYGLVLGLGFDTILRGLFGPRELSTIAGFLPLLIVIIMALMILWLLWKEPELPSDKQGDGKHNGLLLIIGPYLVLQFLFLQSLGWIEEAAGLSFPLGFLTVTLGNVIAAVGVSLGLYRPRSLHPLAGALFTIYLIIASYTAASPGGWIFLLVFLGQFFLGWGLAVIARVNSQENKPGLGRTTAAVTGGMLIFLTLVFGYYVAQDIALPFPRQIFPAASALLGGLMIILANFQTRSGEKADWEYSGVILSGILVLVPLVIWLVTGSGPIAQEPEGFPVKILGYNIHSAFHIDGNQDLEGIARVIEESGADIIGLQEVSRDRLMDGSADIPAWLSKRLGMPYLFQGTEEPIWGNAILSRYPILESGSGELPLDSSLIKRGYMWAKIDIGEKDPLLFIVTHLHQVEADSQIRQLQVPPILDFWDGQEKTVFVGDLNARPGSPEIGLIYGAGLVDSWVEAGEGDGFTDSSFNPNKRIDYIWHSPDLVATEIQVIQTLASDHMPVLAKLE